MAGCGAGEGDGCGVCGELVRGKEEGYTCGSDAKLPAELRNKRSIKLSH